MKFNFKKIEKEKLDEIEKLKTKRSLISAIKKAKKKNIFPIIGEIKQESPSLGKIKKVDLIKTALEMEKSNVCAISILTDKHFGGEIGDLTKVKKAVRIPVLRKDFIINEFQVFQSYFSGADVILLIVSLLKEKLKNLLSLTHQLKMEAIVEIHSEKDLKLALKSEAKLIGINNRDLKTLKIDFKTTEKLALKIPKDKIIISESGIRNKEDIIFVKNAGADAALIGTSIMLSKNIGEKIKDLTNLKSKQ